MEDGAPPQGRAPPVFYKKGDTGEVEMDVGVGKKMYKWEFDGKDFQWYCMDHGKWFKLLSKKLFVSVLKQMRGEDRSWNEPSHPKDFQKNNVRVWRRKASNQSAKVDEIKVEADYHGLPPAQLYNLLHEHAFRATWDTNMKKGYNIARFAHNNDIGYYEAAFPLVTSRDFVNQRGWVEMGKEHYIIANFSEPHPAMPPGKSVRGRSFITAYYIRPCHTDPTGTTITYMTCSDPGGWIPSRLINEITSHQGPKILINLAEKARELPSWLEKCYSEYVKGGKKPLAGPWDHTFEKPGQFHPRDPSEPGDYRVQVTPLDQEKKEVEELNSQYDKSLKDLMMEEAEAHSKFLSEMSGVVGSVKRTASFKKSAFSDIRQVYEGGDASEPPKKIKAAEMTKRLEEVETAVKNVEGENQCLRERLSVFARTSGADPFARKPADEPRVCSDFRSSVADITTSVALELEESGRSDQVTMEEYLHAVLQKLELTYPLEERIVPRCPMGVAVEGPIQGTVSYDQLWKFIEYTGKPDMMDVYIVRLALLLFIVSTCINIAVMIHLFRENYWELGLMALVFIMLGDYCLWWCCRDVHYKDRPFKAGGQATPLLWPTRLQLIPLVPAMAVMLLKRVPAEMTDKDSTATHANIMYRFAFFFTFLRMLLHNAPVVWYNTPLPYY
eukprot:TRINITY_DN12829_c0_g1_i1.p1 TRINITY_DN12829_c0_g1~~TRINITY_DN12829_c0_g1_i1.p1  ORF type:complete len:668 (+),score=229.88 TRINITY_DN12829_c0_g1_i1:155-2158(+)